MMLNKLYLSSGAFTGRLNNRNPRLLANYYRQVDCDGYEFMVMDNFYPEWDAISRLYRAENVPIYYVHADKRIGDLMSDNSDEAYRRLLALFERNCKMTVDLNVHRMVFHGWGVPDSDAHFEQIYSRLGVLLKIADVYGIHAMLENCLCLHGSPCERLETICSMYPGISLVLDTRQAQFHRELPQQVNSILWKNVRHIHINDFSGDFKEWDKLYSIPQLGQGDVDWRMFTLHLKQVGYHGTITLESPSMLANAIDADTFNQNFLFIRQLLS